MIHTIIVVFQTCLPGRCLPPFPRAAEQPLGAHLMLPGGEVSASFGQPTGSDGRASQQGLPTGSNSLPLLMRSSQHWRHPAAAAQSRGVHMARFRFWKEAPAERFHQSGNQEVSQGKCFPIYAIDKIHLSPLGSGLLCIHYELTCSKEGFNCGTLFVLGGKMERSVVLLVLVKD